MEKSEVPIVIRWRVYLQSFMHLLRRIKGKHNGVADWQSRLYYLFLMAGMDEETARMLSDETFRATTMDEVDLNNLLSPVLLPEPELDAIVPSQSSFHDVPDGARVVEIPLPEHGSLDAGGPWCRPHTYEKEPEDYVRMVHNSRRGHWGARKTWSQLNRYFPGHKIPYQKVVEFVKDCPRCQADARKMVADIKPVVRVIVPEGYRTSVGIDLFTVTPADKYGNCMLVIILNRKTKLVALFPGKDYTEKTVATAIIRYMITYGVVDDIASDPGSQFMGAVVKQLNEWLGIRHVVSLVDVHESNGAERSGLEMFQLLRSITNDERLQEIWGEPHILGLVEFHLNDRVNSETGHSAFELTFGSEDVRYFRLPEGLSEPERCSRWLVNLNENLQAIREICRKHQHVRNDVECRHLNLKSIESFVVDRLTLFSGTRAEAERLAMEDANQFVIRSINAYRGDPETRTTMQFEITWEDGETSWRTWDRDLFNSVPYEQFCHSRPELFPIIYDLKQVSSERARINSFDITLVTPGEVVFISLRYFGFFVYDKELDLPNKWHTEYVIKMRYDRWETPGSQRIIIGKVDLFGVEYRCSNYIVFAWGNRRELRQNMYEITEVELRSNRSLLLCVPEGRYRNVMQRRYNPPEPVPNVEDTTVEAQVVEVATLPVAPENIEVTPVARKSKQGKRQHISHQPSAEQLELLNKTFTDDEDESKAYYVAEVRYFPDFEQVCCLCVPYIDRNLRAAKDLAAKAKYQNIYDDDHIFDCDYVTTRVQEYGKGVKQRKSGRRNKLNSVEFFDDVLSNQCENTESTYEQAAHIFEQEIDRLHAEQLQHSSSQVSSNASLPSSLLVITDTSTQQGAGCFNK